MVTEIQAITIHALSWLETDLLEVKLLGMAVLELTRKLVQLITTSRCP